jgi:hypothetical protein
MPTWVPLLDIREAMDPCSRSPSDRGCAETRKPSVDAGSKKRESGTGTSARAKTRGEVTAFAGERQRVKRPWALHFQVPCRREMTEGRRCVGDNQLEPPSLSGTMFRSKATGCRGSLNNRSRDREAGSGQPRCHPAWPGRNPAAQGSNGGRHALQSTATVFRVRFSPQVALPCS